ncbi:MAG: hypothetical protein ACTSR2_02250 [Candidatus Hodarchaeales archaeon]
MSPQTRKTVLNRIRSYLRQHPNEMKGVRSVKRNRLEALIKRLDEFSPIETLNWNNPDRKLFREVAVSAGIQFVRDYPMLYHTPNALRACFGMPTRNDRKKGRFSSIFYRNEAFGRQFRPRYQDLEKLEEMVQEVEDENFEKEKTLLVNYIDRAKNRKYTDDLIDAPESDHSETSISNLKKFLERHNFKNFREAPEEEEEKLLDLDGIVLAPDLIAQWQDREVWIELKEYRDLSFNSKVVYQVFRYLYQNPLVILITISPIISFSELLEMGKEGPLESSVLKEWALKIQDKLNGELEKWGTLRNSFLDLGKNLDLSPRFETLFLTITNEIVTREIGLIGTEQRGLEKFLELLDNFEGKISIFDFDSFMEEENNLQLCSEYCLLLKFDFPFEPKGD